MPESFIPGIGPISAAVIYAEYGDISNFSNPSLVISASRFFISLQRELYRVSKLFNSMSKIELLTPTVLAANSFK